MSAELAGTCTRHVRKAQRSGALPGRLGLATLAQRLRGGRGEAEHASSPSARAPWQALAILLKRWVSTTLFLLALAPMAHAQRISQAPDENQKIIQKLLQVPEADIDLSKAKLVIDRMMDPSVDVDATLARLDEMARGIRKALPVGASKRLTLDALRFHIYQPNEWNERRPFQYDLEDPYGRNIKNKLLSNYLITRKGNCVSMPLLFIFLGQRLGLDVSLAAAPNHLFVQWRDSDGKLYNLETTSGAGFTRDAWLRQQSPMTDIALKSGIYLRPMPKKEAIVAMAETLMAFYEKQDQPYRHAAMAQFLLKYSPNDICALLNLFAATQEIRRQEFVKKYPIANDIPINERPRLLMLNDQLESIYDRAYGLGWRPLEISAKTGYGANAKFQN
ncbi:transglutaminase family protein [Acidovorax sp. NCPPB 3576]|uniref:transglutaminase family protein n=1 Tax=Acidovorax sp. NCPPB 3576 TaxID=2940488 RepID=UPI00234B8403|nr:transglutaminase family protein [Acidovorax sp. NCPPB 3576]WCM86436.1 transglutaminase-like domain-containing protein [Acidovorax sp. NCPPB 3576]